MSLPLHEDIAAARTGDRDALTRVIRSVRPWVHRLALRFFGCPSYADDATQEAMILVATKLDRYAGRSAFTTWVYRVATRRFLSMARSPSERASVGFEAFSQDLASPPTVDLVEEPTAERDLILAEIRIGCTLAMLQCMDRSSRMAYILGEIVEIDHEAASEILGCTRAAYRKRLERSRESITRLMRGQCGVFDPHNTCQCTDRIPIAIQRGHLKPRSLVFAPTLEQARAYPEVLQHIQRLEELQRAGAIYRSHPDPTSRHALEEAFRETTGRMADVHG